MVGEIAALTTAVCWSFTAMFFSYSGRRIGSATVNRSRLLLAVMLYAVAHTVLEGQPLPLGSGLDRVGWLALSAMFGLVLGDSMLFQSFVLVGPRLAMLMMSMVPIISTVLAWLLLGQHVTAIEAAGIALTVGGIGWVVTEPKTGAEAPARVMPIAPSPTVGSTPVGDRSTTARHGDRLRGIPGRLRAALHDNDAATFRVGILLGLGGALGQASGLIAAERGLVDGFPALTASYIRILVAAFVMWSLTAWRGRLGSTLGAWKDGRAMRALAAGTVVGPFIGVSLSLVAIQHARVGIAATLMALPPVLLIPLGYLAYGERVSRRGIVGTLVAFGGVALILLPL